MGLLKENDYAADEVNLSCSLDMFEDHARVKKMLKDIPTIVPNGGTKRQPFGPLFIEEKPFEDLKTILDKYQAQPHLMDSHLEEMLTILFQYIIEAQNSSQEKPMETNETTSHDISCEGSTTSHTQVAKDDKKDFQDSSHAKETTVADQAFKYIYLLSKVRGYKSIVKKFPHEVSHLMPIICMLETYQTQDCEFYNIYVLLLWLSIVIYMPFSLDDFSAASAPCSAGTVLSPVKRILKIIDTELGSSQSSRDMAAFLVSRLVTRPDLKHDYLAEFVQHSTKVISESSMEGRSSFKVLGHLRALGLIWKHGRRDELLPLSGPLLQSLLAGGTTRRTDSLVRKLALKLVQRIGLTFLPPRLAAWRYQRGKRSLAINVVSHPEAVVPGENSSCPNPEKEEDVSVAAEVADIIDELLNGLKDHDTIVRYSCSKGVGRVCARLPLLLAGEVVGAVLGCFSPTESHHACHGGCLALAELGRRGLLLPSTLPEVVQVLQKAFVYDKLLGQNSVGSNVRDAACYLCWALARAYEPSTLAPYVQQLATGLLLVALFDREIPCRHAASAAFQEHVGRQGNFPHGIDILTRVDYFSVGIRATSYLELAPFVASFQEYSVALAEHLVEHKLSHWDVVVRQLAAKSLALVAQHCPEHCSAVLLPRLLTAATGAVLVARHGAILALGSLAAALSALAASRGLHLSSYLSAAVLQSMWRVSEELRERRLVQGAGGAYVRVALAEMMWHCCTAKLPVPRPTIHEWTTLLEESIVYEDEEVNLSGVKAIAALWSFSCEELASLLPTADKEGAAVNKVDAAADKEGAAADKEGLTLSPDTLQRYLQLLKSDREHCVQGWAAALGGLPRTVLETQGPAVLSGLMAATREEAHTKAWAMARKAAVQSALNVALTRSFVGRGCVGQQELEALLTCFLTATEDYTTDRRGDVGAWVREAAVTAMQELLLAVAACQSSEVVVPESQVSAALCRVVQLCVERIDRTRRVAGAALSALLYSVPAVPHIPHHSYITTSVLQDSVCRSINWGSDRVSFPLLQPLLALAPYTRSLTLGYAYSLGGVSATLAQSSKDALEGHLMKSSPEDIKIFIRTLIEVLTEEPPVERLVLPVLRTLEHFIASSALLDQVLEEDAGLSDSLVMSLRRSCQGCSDYHKLVAVCATMAEMLRLDTSSSRSLLNQLLLFLGYQYPKVRSVTATSLVTALGEYGDDLVSRGVAPSQDALDQVLNVLEETLWMEASLAVVREQRNKCCLLLNLQPPAPKKKVN